MQSNKEELVTEFFLIISLISLLTNNLTRILSFFWIGIGVYYIIKNKGYKKIGIEKYILIYYLSQGLSLIWAKDFDKSYHEYYRHLYALIPIFFISQISFLERIKEKSLDIACGIITFYYFAYVNLQYFKIIKTIFRGDRYVGFTDGSVVKYAYVIGILCIYSFFKILKKEKKWGLLLVMNLYLLILSQARGSWLGVLFSFLLMIIFYYRNLNKTLKYITYSTVPLISIIYFLRNNKIVLKYINRAKSITNTTTDMSNVCRIEMWKDSILKFKETNFMGLGYKNNFGYKAKNLVYDHPHSDYFYILSSSGVIGIFGYLYLLVGLLVKSLRNIKNDIWLFIFGVLIFLSSYGIVEVLIQTNITLTLTMFLLSLVKKEEE